MSRLRTIPASRPGMRRQEKLDVSVLTPWPSFGKLKIIESQKYFFIFFRDNEIFVKTASEYNKIGENGTFHTLTNQIITANTKMLEVYKWNNASLNKIKSIPLKIERPTAVITNQPVGGSHMFIGAVGSVTSVSNTNHSSSVISQEKLPINANEPVIDFALVSGDR